MPVNFDTTYYLQMSEESKEALQSIRDRALNSEDDRPAAEMGVELSDVLTCSTNPSNVVEALNVLMKKAKEWNVDPLYSAGTCECITFGNLINCRGIVAITGGRDIRAMSKYFKDQETATKFLQQLSKAMSFTVYR